MPVTEGLGPEARALLDAAREGLSPDAAAVRRVHARIQLAATGTAAGAALGIKLGAIALVAVVAAGIAVVARRGPTPGTMPVIEIASPPERPQQVAVHESVLPAAPADEDLITIEPPSAASPQRRAGSQAMPVRGSTATATAVAGARPEAPRHPGIELGREVELVDLAMAALSRSDAAGALRITQEYAAEAAGRGQLTQDAAAIEIEALCKLRDPGARDKLAAFDARFPRSAQRSRLEAACR
jgi:hypothetical protein